MSEQHLESLDFYLKSAEKAIKVWGHPNMLNSEDDISHVAYMMMMGDSKFDGRGSVTGYRMSYAKYGILDLFSAYKKKRFSRSLDGGDEGKMSLGETTPDPKAKNGIDNYMINNIEQIITEAPELRFRESDAIVRHYLTGQSLREIADVHRITHEGVRLNINSGIQKLREKFHNDVDYINKEMVE